MKKIITKSAEQTKCLGRNLAKTLFSGVVLSLIGDLGSGKTCFTKGIALGLEVNESECVNSPSFVLVKEYPGRLPLYHLDFYRLGMGEVGELGLDEYFYKDGITVIEWGNRAKKLLPEAYLEINFKIPDKAAMNTREIKFIPHGRIYQQALKKMFKEIPFGKYGIRKQ